MIFSVLVCSIALGAPAAEQTPPDQRTWDEAFVSMSTTNVHHYGDRDAARLRQLDHNRTLKLLLGWLSEDQPDYLRRRGIQCLGYNAFREAIPAGALQGNPELAWRYALVMKDHNITSAAPVVAVLIDSSDKMTRWYAADFFVQHPTVLHTEAIATNHVVLSVVQERVNVLQQQIAQADRRLDRFAEQEKRLQRTPKNEWGKIVLEDEQLECRAMESHRKELIARDRAKRNE